MKRRQVLRGIAGLGLGLAAPASSFAQRKPALIGLLDGGERVAWWAAFRKQMSELGYVEGGNIRFEPRFARGRFRDLPGLADELLQLQVDVIVTASTEASIAASRASDKVPIVTTTGGDHVAHGLARSLAQPGGNVTGMTSIASQLTGKRLELLREVHPKLARLAVLWQADNAGSVTAIRDLQSAAEASRISLQNLGIRRADDIAVAFSTAAQKAAEAVYVPLGPLMYARRHAIGELAVKHRLLSMHTAAEMVEAGGLVAYGTNYPDLFRQAAVYVDKILKGMKPAELPIEQPSKFDLVVNLRTAKALGFAIPRPVLLRASRVID